MASLGIPGGGRIAHIDHSILDVGMPQSILDEGHVGPRVQEMHRNRVAERMKAPFGFQCLQLAILLHHIPVGPAFQGEAFLVRALRISSPLMLCFSLSTSKGYINGKTCNQFKKKNAEQVLQYALALHSDFDDPKKAA